MISSPPDHSVSVNRSPSQSPAIIAPNNGSDPISSADVDVQLQISDQSPDLIEDGFDLLVKVTDQPPEGLAGKPLGPVRQLLCASPAYRQQHGTPQHPQHTVLPQFTAAQALAEGRLREVLPQWRYTGSYQGAACLCGDRTCICHPSSGY